MVKRNAKVRKIVLEGYGNYLKMEKGCFVLKDSKGKETRYPALEMDLGEIELSEGNVITTGALTYCALWFIDVAITTRFGEPVAYLKNFLDDSNVNTRIQQYESLRNGKSLYLLKQFAIGKVEGESQVLRKYGLEPYPHAVQIIEGFLENDLTMLRSNVLRVEGKYAQHYFRQLYSLFPEGIRPVARVSYEAYAGLNNVFNLCYTFLKWKVYRAIVNAHLEPFLGYLHSSLNPFRPNLVCDFMELYRYLIDDFLIQNCKKLTKKDFCVKTVTVSHRKVKRMFLKEELASELVDNLHGYFRNMVAIPRIRSGRKQEIETLINEEAYLLAQYLREEKESWNPRIVALP
jgi:CRISPR-associated protein Cas1